MKKYRKNVAMLLCMFRVPCPFIVKIGIVVLTLFLSTSIGAIDTCQAEIYGQKIVKLKTGEKTVLRDVVDDIFKQTGYKIVVSEELSSVPVAGIYEDVSIEDFLRRVFKKYNVSVIYDEKDQLAYVRSFGENLNQNQKGSYVAVPKDELLNEGDADQEATDPLSGVSLAELHRLQVQQLEEMEKMRNDPQALDPQSDIPLADLQRMQQQQLEEMERQKNDPEALDPQSGVPLAELQQSQAQQLEEMEARKNNPEALDPQSGIPMGELRAKQARQLEVLKKNQNDPNAVDPLMNIPMSDLPQ